jgi:hypothetical protein
MAMLNLLYFQIGIKAVREIGNACPPPLMRAWLQAVITHI